MYTSVNNVNSYLELPSIGWLLSLPDSSPKDWIASCPTVVTFATRLLTEPLSRRLPSAKPARSISEDRLLKRFVRFGILGDLPGNPFEVARLNRLLFAAFVADIHSVAFYLPLIHSRPASPSMSFVFQIESTPPGGGSLADPSAHHIRGGSKLDYLTILGPKG